MFSALLAISLLICLFGLIGLISTLNDLRVKIVRLQTRLDILERATPEILNPDYIPPQGCGRQVNGRWVWVMPKEKK